MKNTLIKALLLGIAVLGIVSIASADSSPIIYSGKDIFVEDGKLYVDEALTVTDNIIRQDTDGGYINIKSNCVTDSTDSGVGTQVLTGVIPAGATTLGVTCIVDTVIAGAGASTWSLGDGTDADLYGTGLAFTAGTTVDHTDYTASPRTQAWSASAGDLTLTANAGQFDSGAVTCCAHYYDFSR